MCDDSNRSSMSPPNLSLLLLHRPVRWISPRRLLPVLESHVGAATLRRDDTGDKLNTFSDHWVKAKGFSPQMLQTRERQLFWTMVLVQDCQKNTKDLVKGSQRSAKDDPNKLLSSV